MYITPIEINSYLHRKNKKYNICSSSLHSHRLRHTFITRCVEKELEEEFEKKSYNLEYECKGKYRKLEKENNRLQKIIDKFYETVDKFIVWICHKFGFGESKELIKNFQEETHTFIDPVKQLEHEKREKEWDLEL